MLKIRKRFCICCGLKRKLNKNKYCKQCQEINDVIYQVRKEKREKRKK